MRLYILLNYDYNNLKSVSWEAHIMFIGREKELRLLNKLYTSEKFEFLVLYGRRRVGKTFLLREFASSHNCIFFSAQEKNDRLNLEDFSKTVLSYSGEDYLVTFQNWEAVFSYIGKICNNEKLVLIIDEFPFMASENPSIKSMLQHMVDHVWREKNILLILCGSSVSFMENEVMGYKSPLYGRCTAQLELPPFDYLESAKFFPNYSNLERLFAYGILGGIPCYLQTFHDKRTIAENIETQILRTGSFLKDEPQLLLKMELREPTIYNSIFEAISSGASRMNDISQKIHEETYKCSKYLSTLQNIKLVKKIVPCGEKETSRRTIYRIADNFYSFWYHFVFTNKSYYEILGEQEAAEEIMLPENMSRYMGGIFELVCKEYMVRQAKARKLPFVPAYIEKWWGNNPVRKVEDDIDILLMDQKQEKRILCECKFKNESFGREEYETLKSRTSIFADGKEFYFYVFSKGGFTSWVQDAAKQDGVTLVEIDDLFFE